MSHSLIRLYLILLPVFSLIAIILSTTRIVFGESFSQIYLLFLMCFELTFIALNYQRLLKSKYVLIFLFLLIPSLFVGIVNNEISRRHITDFIIPMIFISKVVIFSDYWPKENVSNYFKYYSKVTIVFSLILIVFVYKAFASEGASRISIFPPLELTSVFYLYNNIPAFLLCILLVFLYGKRAQLISLMLVSFMVIFRLSANAKIIVIILLSFLSFGLFNFISDNPENMSVRRVTYTIENLDFSSFEAVNKLSAGRFAEVTTILNDMEPIHTFFGIGMGYSFELYTNSGELKKAANAHFTPLGLISKYGFFFTFYLYFFIFSQVYYALFKSKSRTTEISGYVVLFIVMESMFSYSLFVTSINAVLVGYIISTKKCIS
ncbi:hypothetical protein [Vibrio owensii]|uniref:hypothetical protein n=1 Tax=Vibrio owensii TaxID=696485 RepID=UPI003AADFCDA